MKRKYPMSLFIVGFITNILFHFSWLFVPSIIFLFVGIFVDWSSYLGLALLIIDIIISFIDQIRIRRTMLRDSDNEGFREFQDTILQDGNVFENARMFVENAIEQTPNDEEEN